MPSETERVLFVQARPEDATAAAGGTIAMLVAAGEAVTVVTCATGHSRDADGAELTAALRELGVTDHRQLDAVVADLVAVGVDIGATAVISCGGHGGGRDADRDRDRARKAARSAAGALGVALFEPVPEGSPGATVVVDVAPVAERRRAALAALRGPQPQPIMLVEAFRRVPTAAPNAGYRTQPLGVKLVVALLALAAGAAVGALTTAIHQANVSIGGVPVPWGLVLALLAAAALIVGLRVVTRSRAIPALGALALMGMTAILAAPTSGGSVVVPANPAGAIWTFAPAVVTLFVLAWPNLDRRAVTGYPQQAAAL